MDFTASITTDAFLELKCHLCSNHLSHFPVYMSSNKQNVCGRCVGCLNLATSVHNELYETLAQFVQFPCRYNPDGCPAQLLPKDVPQHEENCEFQKCKCPIEEFASCDWEGPRPSLLHHCQAKHGELFLQNGTFQMDLTLSYKKTNWLQCKSRVFVVKQNFLPINKSLVLSICKVGSDIDADDFTCAVNFSNANVNLSVNCHEKVFVKEQPVKIFLDSLTDRNSRSSLVTGKISLEKCEEEMPRIEEVDHKILEIVKCVLCLEYTLPPIYHQEGKTILGETLTLCEHCWSVKGIVGKPYTRNLILNQMANLLNYPCKYTKKGCSFIAKPPEMDLHQESCMYGNLSCPLNTLCGWAGMRRNLNDHIVHVHSYAILSSEPVAVDLPHCNIIYVREVYIIKFLARLFRLEFVVSNKKYYWTVQMIGPFEPGFMFEVEVIDENNNKCSLVATESCIPLIKPRNVVDSCVCFQLGQLAHLRKCEQTITFKVMVFK